MSNNINFFQQQQQQEEDFSFLSPLPLLSSTPSLFDSPNIDNISNNHDIVTVAHNIGCYTNLHHQSNNSSTLPLNSSFHTSPLLNSSVATNNNNINTDYCFTDPRASLFLQNNNGIDNNNINNLSIISFNNNNNTSSLLFSPIPPIPEQTFPQYIQQQQQEEQQISLTNINYINNSTPNNFLCISTPPFINPSEEIDCYSNITSPSTIPPTPLTALNTPHNNNNNISSINSYNNNNTDPNIFDTCQNPNQWFPLFPTESPQKTQSEEGGEIISTYIPTRIYKQYSCSSTPLIVALDSLTIMEEGQSNPQPSQVQQSHNSNESEKNGDGNNNTSNSTKKSQSSEMTTTTTTTTTSSSTPPLLAPKSPITVKQSNNNNNINSLLNTSPLIKREELDNNNNIDVGENTTLLAQKNLPSTSTSSTSPRISSNPPSNIINPIRNVVGEGIVSVGVGVDAMSSTTKHEHLSVEQERNKKRLRTSVTEQQEDETEEKKHHCPECGRGFNRKFNMQTHRSTHDPNRVKPFACEYPNCGSRFTRKHDLKRHINGIHKGEKVHECSVCRKPFSRKDAWKRHITTCGKI